MMEQVAVIALFSKNGMITPTDIIWETGQQIKIDNIEDIKKSANQKYGIRGIRYTCKIRGRQIYLYRDEDTWIMTTDLY